MPPTPIDFDPSLDYYKTLGLIESASADQIKSAYRKLAKDTHPDQNGGNKIKEGRFKTISVAYHVLGDPTRRDLYDQIRANGGQLSGEDPAFDLSDLFGQFFSQNAAGRSKPRATHRPTPPPPRHEDIEDAEVVNQVKASDGSWLRVNGLDLHSDLRISFDLAIFGTTATIVTRDGEAHVKIPPGTSSGKTLRLKGKGLHERGNYGDHYVIVQIDVPRVNLEEHAELKRQLTTMIERLRKLEIA